MGKDWTQRLGEIISHAEAIPPDQRERFVRDACGGDADMEKEAWSLLGAVASAQGFLNRPTARGVGGGIADRAAKSVREAPGTMIGRYRLLQEIGEGGFGVVFLAEQREPVERRVAIKIIKLGMDTKQVVARFEAERQALAMMDHPSIARVFDGGATEIGRPYFVMELVRGDPITRHCQENGLGTTERLELFEQVCRAVQHAHTKGIIHRDIKPGNVLVTMVDGRPVPKIIDFGIAKATSARLTEKTFFTEHRQLIGTPEYMSPEQADNSGVDVDARTDIYSLGVLLYELLTGVTPFEPERLRSAEWGELLRIIREDDPPKPSTRLSTVGRRGKGARQGPGPALVARQVRGDLDWIVMRCLEKNRSRRYGTAEGLAADIRRHLCGEPVEAAPPSAGYRVWKFVRRHRGAVVAGGLLALAVTAGVVGTGVFAVKEGRARDRAETAEGVARERADDLQKVSEFQKSQLRAIEPEKMGAQIKADLLAETETSLKRAKTDDAELVRRMQSLQETLGETNFTNLALKTLDKNIFGKSLSAIREQFKDRPLVRADLLATLADTMDGVGMTEEAVAPMQEALAEHRRLLGNESAVTLTSIGRTGNMLKAVGRHEEAEALLREGLDTSARVRGRNDPQTLTAMSELAGLLSDRRKFSEADPLFAEALERSRKVLGPDDRETLARMSAQAFNLRMQGKLPEAEGLCRECAERCRRVLGPDDRDTLTAVNMLGSLLWAEKKFPEASGCVNEALAIARRTLGDDNSRTLVYLFNSGSILRDLGDKAEAQRRFREAYERSLRVNGPVHQYTLAFVHSLADLQLDQKEFAEAAGSYQTAVAGMAKMFGESDNNTLKSRRGLGMALLATGRLGEAEAALLAAEAGFRAKAPESPDRTECVGALVSLYEKWDAAEPGKGYGEKRAPWSAQLSAIRQRTAEVKTDPDR
jgi:eukaryotic-like serine/threonine-protein kinase